MSIFFLLNNSFSRRLTSVVIILDAKDIVEEKLTFYFYKHRLKINVSLFLPETSLRAFYPRINACISISQSLISAAIRPGDECRNERSEIACRGCDLAISRQMIFRSRRSTDPWWRYVIQKSVQRGGTCQVLPVYVLTPAGTVAGGWLEGGGESRVAFQVA